MNKMVNMLPKASVEENIVVALARSKKPLTYYQLWKKHKVAASNKTVLTTLSRLEKKRIVISKQERKGRKRKFYELTFFGLIASLTYKWAWQLIDEIAEARKDSLPLVFGKWAFFKKEHILDEIIGRLKIMSYKWWKNSVSYKIVPETLGSLFTWEKLKAQRKLGPANNAIPLATYEQNVYRGYARKVPNPTATDFTGFVLGISDLSWLPFDASLIPPDMEKEILKKIELQADARRVLLQIYRRDPDLRNYVSKRLKFDIELLEFQMENVQLWRRWIHTRILKEHRK